MKNIFSTNSTSGTPTLSSKEVPTTTTVTQDPLLDNPSDLDCSSDSLPPPPKQPRIKEPDQEVSVINIDVADVAKRRSTLNDRQKYNFFCNHFSPALEYKFPRKESQAFGINTSKGISG